MDNRDESRILILASDIVGVVAARNLSGDVMFFGTNESVIQRVGDDVETVRVLEDVDTFHPPEEIDAAVVATAEDSTNMLAARRVQLTTDAPIVVRLNEPDYRDLFTDIGVETVCTSETVGNSLTTQVAGGNLDG